MNNKIIDSDTGNGQYGTNMTTKNLSIEDLNELKRASEQGFCRTQFSRRGKFARTDAFGPFDEGKTFHKDLTLLMERPDYPSAPSQRIYAKLINDIQLFHDTYFYTASVLSLLIIDENNGTLTAYNADTYIHAVRDITDWDIANTHSIGHYMLRPENKNAVFILPQLMTTSNKYLFKYEDHEGERIKFASIVPEIKNDALVFKNAPVDINSAKKGDFEVCSAIVRPLWDGDRLLGAMLISNNMTNCFTNFMTDILPYSVLDPMITFTDCIGLILKQLMD